MKHFILIFFAMSAGCITCYGEASNNGQAGTKASIGIDLISGICLSSILITASYKISPNWNTGFDAGMTLSHAIDFLSDLDKEHKDILSNNDSIGSEHSYFREKSQKFSLYAGYWPVKTFKGPYMTIGIQISHRHGADMTIGGGYTFRITENLYGTIGYQSGIMELINMKSNPYNGIRAIISHVF